ncbi:MAG: dihydroneopterin aldolase [Bdellovibrionales bacterium]|nr:dihydroneopterin aldolase [Bdellovibrionales bacterium]
MNQDTIYIEGLRLMVRVGCTAEERAHPQRMTAGVRVTTDVSTAVRSDKLDDTVCYGKLADSLVRHAENGSWNLVETLGDELIQLIFEQFPPVQRVELDLRKFVIPRADAVGVSMARSRSACGARSAPA